MSCSRWSAVTRAAATMPSEDSWAAPRCCCVPWRHCRPPSARNVGLDVLLLITLRAMMRGERALAQSGGSGGATQEVAQGALVGGGE